ncbi:acetylornithine deacetylase [Idiomarina sp. UBA4520]|jgi:acetylornithine deacetylase|uniref:acetylornithine deacetylase n=1 Tax=Idiomarina sp. UBA4520 TaxID=1946647 RepID=UPI000A9E5E8F|nr:acetylornithine deacetylase [Idiomarina sp. UBA4520]MBF38335.1 acetylornithine deacetylase [Idiomarinaceae bacterium]|tara:strand:+ start:4010 stop:5170 length:1161 start_codon:yes stop_codon:yes gene_type:complete
MNAQSLPSFFSMYQQLIAIPSISATVPKWDTSNKKVIDLLAEWLELLGFECEINELKSQQGKYNLLARRGAGSGGLLLSGHTDTVPYDASRWNFDPFTLTEKNNRWYGLGSIDMKGFFAFVLQVLSDLDASKQSRPIMVLATADEETTMNGAREVSRFANLHPDYCIIGEPTDMRPVYAHKGHMSEVIRIIGRSGHSSDPALGINAIELMHEVISSLMKLKEEFKHKYSNSSFTVPQPTMNFGHIHGGDNANRICGCCELHLDVRPLPGLSVDELYAHLHKATESIQKRYPGSVELISLHHPVPAFEQTPDSALVQLAEKVSQSQAQAVNYCTEAPFLQELGCETLVMGPGSIKQAHQPDEYLLTETIEPTQEKLKKLLKSYCFSD